MDRYGTDEHSSSAKLAIPPSAIVRSRGDHASREAIPAHELWWRRLRLYHASVFGYYVVALIITDITLLVIPYAFSDDYATLNSAIHHTLAGNVQVRVSSGRPLQAGLVYLVYSQIGSLNDLALLRLFGIITLAALAWMLYRALVRAGWTPRWAFPIPLIICTLPSLQIYPAWAQTTLELLAVVPAGCAALLVERAYHEVASAGAAPDKRWEVWRVVGLVAAALLLLLSALMLHQSVAMVYWVFAAISLLAQRRAIGDLLKRFSAYLGVAAIAMAAEYLVVKYSYPILYHQSNPQARITLASPTDLRRNLLLFVTQPLTDSLNFYHIQIQPALGIGLGMREIAAIVALFITCGFILYVAESLTHVVVKLALAFSLLPLSYIPNLVLAAWWPAYRTQSALGGLLTLYLAFALYGWLGKRRLARLRALAPACLWAFAALGMVCAAFTVTNGIALPSYIELHVAIAQVERQKAELASATHIYLIPNDLSDAITSVVRYDEYGEPSTTSWSWWTWPGVSYLAIDAVDPAQANLPVIILQANQTPPPGSVVLDMRRLRDFGVLPLP